MNNNDHIVNQILQEKEGEKPRTIKLSDQALKSIMMLINRCILEERSAIGELQELNFAATNSGLVCVNPPTVKIGNDLLQEIIKMREEDAGL